MSPLRRIRMSALAAPADTSILVSPNENCSGPGGGSGAAAGAGAGGGAASRGADASGDLVALGDFALGVAATGSGAAGSAAGGSPARLLGAAVPTTSVSLTTSVWAASPPTVAMVSFARRVTRSTNPEKSTLAPRSVSKFQYTATAPASSSTTAAYRTSLPSGPTRSRSRTSRACRRTSAGSTAHCSLRPSFGGYNDGGCAPRGGPPPGFTGPRLRGFAVLRASMASLQFPGGIMSACRDARQTVVSRTSDSREPGQCTDDEICGV